MNDLGDTFNRVTHERIEGGLVVSGRTASAKKWADAYVKCIGPGLQQFVIAPLLLDVIERIIDGCREPDDITEYDGFLSASWALLSQLEVASSSDINRLRKHEEDIRSGEMFRADEGE